VGAQMKAFFDATGDLWQTKVTRTRRALRIPHSRQSREEARRTARDTLWRPLLLEGYGEP
jgi:hypothetical protein